MSKTLKAIFAGIVLSATVAVPTAFAGIDPGPPPVPGATVQAVDCNRRGGTTICRVLWSDGTVRRVVLNDA